MQNVMSGQHPEDLRSLPGRVRLPTAYDGIRGWKVALSMDLGHLQIDPEVAEITRRAAALFRELGCEVEEVDLGWNYSALNCCVTWWEGIFAGLVGQYLPRWHYEMDPFVVSLVERGLRLGAARLYQIYSVRGWLWQQLQPILKSHDILICPTLTAPAVKADHNNADPDYRINGVRVSAYAGWIATYGFNQVSQCPVMSVPAGFTSCGVPTGLQIVGGPTTITACSERPRPSRPRPGPGTASGPRSGRDAPQDVPRRNDDEALQLGGRAQSAPGVDLHGREGHRDSGGGGRRRRASHRRLPRPLRRAHRADAGA